MTLPPPSFARKVDLWPHRRWPTKRPLDPPLHGRNNIIRHCVYQVYRCARTRRTPLLPGRRACKNRSAPARAKNPSRRAAADDAARRIPRMARSADHDRPPPVPFAYLSLSSSIWPSRGPAHSAHRSLPSFGRT